MIQIAMYGKGGIGKSTVSSNLSAALSASGKSILQIGCDPKHDSTRLLMGGNSIPTVLNYIRTNIPEKRCLEDLVFPGYGGVCCVEAGGPEPGVGCAGRGILTTFELLEQLGIREIPFDIIVYDVLGDVVCGGFAVPLRHEYADAVFLVTSGEYMSLYAANNILKGIRNYDHNSARVAGIIYNARGLEHEERRVKEFAKAVKLPIVASIPRSDLFANAEKEGGTLIQLYPGADTTCIFKGLADYVLGISCGITPLFSAFPLTETEMESIVLGRKIAEDRCSYTPVSMQEQPRFRSLVRTEKHFLTKGVKNKEPLHGCALAGAVTSAVNVTDALTIVHGPRSCAHILSNFLQSSSLKEKVRHGILMSDNRENVVLPTDMGEEAFIFGGMDELRQSVENAIGDGWDTIFIATTCPAGLIGDDVELAISCIKSDNTDIKIVPLLVDGNLEGDFAQGLVEGYRKVADLVDMSISPEKGWVNIIGEKSLSDGEGTNFRIIENLLSQLGLKVNCRFLNRTNLEKIRELKKAQFNILAHDDDSNLVLRDFLIDRFDVDFFEYPFPIGFRETTAWLNALKQYSDAKLDIELLIEVERLKYETEIAKYRPFLRGRKLLVNSYSRRIDWILDVAFDLGMEVVKVGMLKSSTDDIIRSRYTGLFEVEYDYDSGKRQEDIRKLHPDLVLSNYPPAFATEGVHHDSIPLVPEVGFDISMKLAKRWGQFIRLPATEGWKYDGGESE